MTWRGGYSSEGGLRLTGGASGELGGNAILHAGNYTSYAPAILYSRFAGDLNTLGVSNATSGIYNIGAGYTNGPGNTSLYGTLQAYWNGDIAVQFWHSYNGDSYWRKSVGGTFSGAAWRTNLDSVNYSSYSPTLTGAGASGTWGINVTGSAGSVAWSGVTGKPAQIIAANGGMSGSINWDSYTTAGVYSVGNTTWTGVANAPASSYTYGSVLVTSDNGNVVSQIYMPHQAGLAFRSKWNATDWQGWRYVLDSSNYSAYALPLSGGTINGQLTIVPTLAWNASTPALNIGGTGDARLQVRHIWGKASNTAGVDHLWLNYQNTSNHVQIGDTGGGNNLYVAGNIFTNGYFGGNQVLNASNYSSYAVPLSGGTMSGRLTISPGWTTSGRNYSNEWIELGNYSGLYSPNNSAHFYPNNGTYGGWRSAGSRNGWHGIEFDSSNGNTVLMIGSDGNTSGFHNNNYGWQFRWASGELHCYKNTYGGGTDAIVLDAANYSSYALPRSGGTLTGDVNTTANFSISGRSIRPFENNSYIEFYVGGDANTYYPVRFDVYAWYHFARWSISRSYGDTAPWDPIGTGAHRGGLTFTWEWSGDGAWGGNDKAMRVVQFSEQYTTMVGGMALSVNGIIVWLRGGNAYYRFHGPGGILNGATPYYSTYTAGNGATYSPRSYDANTVSSEVNSRFPSGERRAVRV